MGDSKKSKMKRQNSRKIRDIVAREITKYKDVSEKEPANDIEDFIAQSEDGLFGACSNKNLTKK